MKMFIILLLMFANAALVSTAQAEAKFLCNASCGFVKAQESDTQGFVSVQMMATGTDATAAFTNLQAKCKVLADKNPNVQPPPSLMNGFNVNSNDQGVFGLGYPATEVNSCIEL